MPPAEKNDKTGPTGTKYPNRFLKRTAPVKEKSPVPYLIAVIVVVLLLCGGVILFIYYPDLFSSSSDKECTGYAACDHSTRSTGSAAF